MLRIIFEPGQPLKILLAYWLATLCACNNAPSDLPTWTPADHQNATSNTNQASPDIKGATPAQSPDPSSEEFKRAVTALWAHLCTSCHGNEGAGDGAALGSLKGKVPDMRQKRWQKQYSDAELEAIIAKGKGLMPGFAQQVRPEGIQALVRHIRGLTEAAK
jgi:mono/diheme cytochrome c family protein